MKSRTFVLAAACALGVLASMAALSGGSFAAQNAGAAEMTLSGGKTGDVPFPHGRHQTALGDCGACHGLFPQEKGVVDAMKAQGKIKSKAVMGQCVNCHKTMTKSGEKTGPVSCRACHSIK